MKKNILAIFLGCLLLYIDPLVIGVLFGYATGVGPFVSMSLFLKVIYFLLEIALYVFMGWFVIKKSQSKKWYLAAFPPLIFLFLTSLYAIPFIGLFGVLSVPVAPAILTLSGIAYSFSPATIQIHEYFYYLPFILFAILGGLLAKRGSVAAK